MQKNTKTNANFAVELCFAFFAFVTVSATFLVAEIHLSNGYMLADPEIAEGCAPCSASVALVSISDRALR